MERCKLGGLPQSPVFPDAVRQLSFMLGIGRINISLHDLDNLAYNATEMGFHAF
jgi:hypothetical protein